MQCPFCHPEKIIQENELAYAIYDKYPVSPGHALIITKRHVAEVFDATREEENALWRLVKAVKNEICEKYDPDGWNIGINCGEASGQTIPHLHIHLIPRYKGDMEEPEGGVRGVIPEKRKYRGSETYI